MGAEMVTVKQGVLATLLFLGSAAAGPAQTGAASAYDYTDLQFLGGTNHCDFLGIKKEAARRTADRLLKQMPAIKEEFDIFERVMQERLTEIKRDLTAGKVRSLCQNMRDDLRQYYPSVFRN